MGAASLQGTKYADEIVTTWKELLLRRTWEGGLCAAALEFCLRGMLSLTSVSKCGVKLITRVRAW